MFWQVNKWFLHAHMKFHYKCVQIEDMIRNMQSICMKTLQMIYTLCGGGISRYERWKEKKYQSLRSCKKNQKSLYVKIKCMVEKRYIRMDHIDQIDTFKWCNLIYICE